MNTPHILQPLHLLPQTHIWHDLEILQCNLFGRCFLLLFWFVCSLELFKNEKIVQVNVQLQSAGTDYNLDKAINLRFKVSFLWIWSFWKPLCTSCFSAEYVRQYATVVVLHVWCKTTCACCGSEEQLVRSRTESLPLSRFILHHWITMFRVALTCRKSSYRPSHPLMKTSTSACNVDLPDFEQPKLSQFWIFFFYKKASTFRSMEKCLLTAPIIFTFLPSKISSCVCPSELRLFIWLLIFFKNSFRKIKLSETTKRPSS